MTTRLITPPAALAVSLELARAAARVDGNAMDAEITQAVQGFTEDAEHETGRAFITQTWRVTLDSFPGAIKLPNAPLQSVSWVRFRDMAGVLQTLDPQDYIVDADSEPGYIVPAEGKAWPPTAPRINAVHVEYVCGYGPDDTAVPNSIKTYLLGKVAEQYAQGSTAAAPNLLRLLDRVRVYG